MTDTATLPMPTTDEAEPVDPEYPQPSAFAHIRIFPTLAKR